MERRLAAILAADVAGYSLLMNTDEEATYSAWRIARVEVIDPCIGRLKGRIVKHTGDGFLAEFPTVLAAVECAVNIQQEMGRRNETVANNRQLQFRIGINLGDIIVDDEDIHGDGVNIAARLESIADAGGVCVSEHVYHQVRNKPGFSFQDLGERKVKNIPTPIRAYRVSRDGETATAQASSPDDLLPDQKQAPLETALDYVVSPGQRPAALLVGRDKETEILAEAYRDAEAGRGNIVLIRGEPGIGKSCLADCFAQGAKESGALVAHGQCHETLGSPPFWPWLQILKTLQVATDSAQSSSESIFESLAASDSQRRNSPHSTFARDAGSEQFLLFSRIAGLLAQVASQRTLILVIDDLHWADKSSLLLLQHICGRLSGQSILVIGTYRDMEITRKHPLFEALGDINRQALLRRIALRGLSQPDVSGFIEKSVNRPLPSEILHSLYEKTEGNPLFVSEVIRILQQDSPDLPTGQWVLEIPEGIQEAIGRRLNQLSDECNELLCLAAVIGRKFALRVLNDLLPDSDQFSLLQTLEEATGRGIIEDSDHGMAEFRFRHVLFRDILYDELSLAKKILLHGKVAEILVQLRDEGGEYALGEIARHYYQALQSGQGDNAADYAIRAAKHATRLSAFDEAKGYYELALDVFRIDETRYAERKAEIYFSIAHCMHSSGAAAELSVVAFKRCIEVARQHGQYEMLARAACRIVYVARVHAQARDALATIDEASSYIAGENPGIRAKVLAHRAMALIFNQRRREAEQVAYQAVAVASESDDASAHGNALCITLMVLRGRPEKLSERIRLGEQALALVQPSAADPSSMDSLEWLILSYQEAGDLDRVRQLVAQLGSVAQQSKLFKSRYFAVAASTWVALFEGRWERAERLVEEAVELGSGKLDGGADGVYGAQMFFLNRELGRLPLVQGALTQLLADDRLVWKPGLLATYTELGLVDEARHLFTELAADDFKHVAEDELYLTCLVYLTEACMELDLADEATALYQRLMPYSGQMVSHPTAVCYGPADLYLAMLSSLMNDLAEAEKLFARAATLCEKASPNIWQAHVKYRHAQVLKRHAFGGGKSASHELAGQARSLAQAMGMVNLLAKIARLENQSEQDDRQNPDGLTPKELEVLSLIVQGRSNKRIASKLNRSLATVATHVRAILSKTHTANRTEAAAYAMERNLYKGSEPAGFRHSPHH